jgi:hypothetical protein
MRFFRVQHFFNIVGVSSTCLSRSFAAEFVILKLGL